MYGRTAADTSCDEIGARREIVFVSVSLGAFGPR
jgi:hypothetical protein